MNYSIPPMSPIEALEFIASGTYHQDAICGDGYDSCRCAEFVAGVVLGEPGECGLPEPKREMTGFRKDADDVLRARFARSLEDILDGESIWSSEFAPKPKQIPEV